MLGLLVDFFCRLFMDSYDTATLLDLSMYFDDSAYYEIGHIQVTPIYYWSLLCGLVSFFFILVFCCLFVYKIIKLVGGLIR